MRKLFEKEVFWIILIILISLLAVCPLFLPGFYPFHDEPQIANLYQMIRAISSGQIPPRWAPDMSFNYGYPLFNFYYPLPFYLGSLFHFLLGTNLIWSLKLVFLLSIPFSGICFYLFARKFFGREASFAGATIYVFTPYRAVDLYVRGAVGEMWSFVFIPLVLFFFINLIEKRNLKNIFFSGLALAGLILAHNLTSIIFFPFFLIFCLAIIFQNKEKIYGFISMILGLLAGLSFSAYYWLPAVIERKYIQTGTPYNPFDHFPFFKQLVFPSWGYGASVWGPNDGMSFQIGTVNILVIFISFLFFPFFIFYCKQLKTKSRRLFAVAAFCLLTTVFLMNIRSSFIWKILPLGSYIQFPWRFLILTTFFSSFLVGFLENLPGNLKRIGPFILAVLAVVLTVSYFKPERYIIVNDDYYLERFFAERTTKGKRDSISKDYLNYSEDYLPLTVWTLKRPSALPEKKIEIIKGQIDYQEISPVYFKATSKTEEPTEIIFHTYYFPGWCVFVDGQKVPTRVVEPLGEMSINVPKAEHQITFRFTETPLRFASDLVSLFTLGAFVLLLIFRR